MKVLVTGGGGFLGSHIVSALLARGHEPIAFGRREYPALAARGVRCVRGDLADAEAVKAAVRGCDAVVHSAAIPGIWGKYDTYYRANVLGTQNVVDAVRAHGVGRLLYTSTPSVVHGGDGIDGGDESLPYPDHYLTPYAETKARAEKLVLAAHSPELAVAAIRPHLIFGPGDTQLIPKLLARARTGKLKRIGDGTNRISVSYVENVADAHVLALEHLRRGGSAAGQVYFVNEPEPVNCWDFINSLIRGAGVPEVTKSIPFSLAYKAGWVCEKLYALFGRQEDPPVTRFLATQLATSHWFRTEKAQRDLGWRPRVSLEEGIRRMLESMKQDRVEAHGG